MANEILPCKLDGCEKPVRVRGYCNAHYLRLLKYGDPLHRRGITHGDTERWINSHTHHYGDDCLIWPYARLNNGYPSVRYQGRHWVASRLMCVKAHGEPPKPNMDCCHSCNNGHLGCMNPNHLYWGTRKQNIDDAKAAGTWTQGSPKGRRNSGASKLLSAQVWEIRSLLKAGNMNIAEIARQFSVSRSTIRLIRDGKTYSWLK